MEENKAEEKDEKSSLQNDLIDKFEQIVYLFFIQQKLELLRTIKTKK